MMFRYFQNLFDKPDPFRYNVYVKNQLAMQTHTKAEAQEFLDGVFNDIEKNASGSGFGGKYNTKRAGRRRAFLSQCRIKEIQ